MPKQPTCSLNFIDCGYGRTTVNPYKECKTCAWLEIDFTSYCAIYNERRDCNLCTSRICEEEEQWT